MTFTDIGRGSVGSESTCRLAKDFSFETDSSCKDEENRDEEEESEEEEELSAWSRLIERIEISVSEFFWSYSTQVLFILKTLLFLSYLGYVSYCMYFSFGDENSILLLLGTLVAISVLLYKYSSCDTVSIPVLLRLEKAVKYVYLPENIRRTAPYILYAAASVSFLLFLSFDVFRKHPQNIRSFFGMLGLIFVCFVLSSKPSRVNWHPVFWGFILQYLFAFLTLRTDVGYEIFNGLGDAVQELVGFSDDGAKIVLGKNFDTMGLAFTIAGPVIFFNSLIFLLNHLGVIEVLVVNLGNFLSFCLETGPVESVISAANIFLGLAEAPMLVRPYLSNVTKSELHTVMTCGFASISGGAMAIYIAFGVSTNHLLTAAVISAPAALAVSKLMYPETQKVDRSLQKDIHLRDHGSSQNLLSSCAEGAGLALTMVGAIASNMIAFVSLLAMLNSILTWFGKRAGYDYLTFEKICSWVLYPLAYLMGADSEDCGRVGSLIGTKLLVTPMVSYAYLGEIIENRWLLQQYLSTTNGSWSWDRDDVILHATNKTLYHGILSKRSEVVATYAMCGFSAFTSIGICLAVLVPLCPSRKNDFLDLVVRSFVAGNMASFLTASVAGVMYTD